MNFHPELRRRARLHPRRGSPFLNPFPPSPCVPTSLLPYLPFPSSRDEKLVTATRLDSALTNRDVRKSFRIRSYENCRVSNQQFPFWNSPLVLRASVPVPSLCLLYFLYFLYLLYFLLLAHSFAQRSNRNPFAVNRLRTLSIVTGGVPPRILFSAFRLLSLCVWRLTRPCRGLNVPTFKPLDVQVSRRSNIPTFKPSNVPTIFAYSSGTPLHEGGKHGAH